MEYGIWTLIPVLFVIAFALKTKRTLEPLIFADLCDYQRCTDPVRGSVCTVSHRHRLDGCFFPRGDRLFAPMGLFGVRVVRQPHYAVGRIPWNTGIYKGAWKALPGAKVHHDGHLDHGDSYFCG